MMYIVEQGMGWILTIVVSAAFFWSLAPETGGTTSNTMAFDCGQAGHTNWVEMSTWQKQLADACDQTEANHNWQLAYGRMSEQELSKAAVYDPL